MRRNLSKRDMLPAGLFVALLLVFSLLGMAPVSAQITEVSSTSSYLEGAGGEDGGTLTLPFSGSVGDLVLVAVCGQYVWNDPENIYNGPPTVSSNAGTISAISGGSIVRIDTPTQRIDTYEMVATASSGSVTISIEGLTIITAVLAVYSGTSGIDAVGSASHINSPPNYPEATVTTASANDLVVGFLGEEDGETPDEPGTGFTYVNGYELTIGHDVSGVMVSCEDSNSQSYDADTEVTPSFSIEVPLWFVVAVALKPS